MERELLIHTEFWREISLLPTPTKDRVILALRLFTSYGPEDAGLFSLPVPFDAKLYPDWKPRALRVYQFKDTFKETGNVPSSPSPIFLAYVLDYGQVVHLIGFLADLLPADDELARGWEWFSALDRGIHPRREFADYYNNLSAEETNQFETEVSALRRDAVGRRCFRAAFEQASDDMADILGLSPLWVRRLFVRFSHFLTLLDRHLSRHDMRLRLVVERAGGDVLRLPVDEFLRGE